MTIDRPAAIGITILALFGPGVLAQDELAAPGPRNAGSFEALLEEYDHAIVRFSAEFQGAYEKAKKMGRRKVSNLISPIRPPSSRRAFSPSPSETPKARRQSTR